MSGTMTFMLSGEEDEDEDGDAGSFGSDDDDDEGRFLSCGFSTEFSGG